MNFSLDVVKLLYELIARLIGIHNKRRRDIFEEMIQPIFDRFLEVHAAYNELFLNTLQSFPFPFDDGRCWISGSYEVVDGERVQQKINETRQQFLSARERNEWVRDMLRQQAKEILGSISYIDEKRFLMSIIYYFLEQGPCGVIDDEYIDLKINGIESSGGISELATPSSRLAIELNGTNDPGELRAIVEGALNNLNQRFSNVCSYFTKTKLTVLIETAD